MALVVKWPSNNKVITGGSPNSVHPHGFGAMQVMDINTDFSCSRITKPDMASGSKSRPVAALILMPSKPPSVKSHGSKLQMTTSIQV